jgi:hypothetical protein
MLRFSGSSSRLAKTSQQERMLLAWAALSVLIGVDVLVKRLLGAIDSADRRLARRAARFLCGGAPAIAWVEYWRTFAALFLVTFNAMAAATFYYLNCVHRGESLRLVLA